VRLQANDSWLNRNNLPIAALVPAFLLLALPVLSQPIQRSQAEVRAFRAANPCPSTGKTKGPCPTHDADHKIPLCAGGEDKASNMHWLAKADHRWKTFVDVRECRKLKRGATTPAK
jgi:hypothetical protein